MMKKIFALMLTGLLLLLNLNGCASKSKLDPNDPVALTMWHVYGSQTDSPMNDSINEFNRTIGKEKGVIINIVSVSNSSAIDEALTAASKNTPGAPELPDLFTAYPRVVEMVGQDRLLNWADYLSERELNSFVEEFLQEGYFDEQCLMLPIAKSTELLFVNQTLFDRFASEVGITSDTLSGYNSLFDAAEAYYDWSNGGDLFQINDFYHYALTGMAAYGENFVVDGALNLESNIFEQIWRPMAHAAIYGGLCMGDGYASDRWKTGEIICNTGSTAGILYLRDYVTYADNTTEDITTSILAYPVFEGGTSTVVHRGGGLFALKNEDERKNEAAVLFARWITEQEHNLNFVTRAGYLPVTDAAFDSLFEQIDTVENPKYRLLYSAVKEMSDHCTYCEIPNYEGALETQSSFEINVKSILSAAHNEYLSQSDDASALDKLVSSSLEELRALYR